MNPIELLCFPCRPPSGRRDDDDESDDRMLSINYLIGSRSLLLRFHCLPDNMFPLCVRLCVSCLFWIRRRPALRNDDKRGRRLVSLTLQRLHTFLTEETEQQAAAAASIKKRQGRESGRLFISE